MINTSKPTTSIVNTTKVSSSLTNTNQSFAIYWDDPLYTWGSSIGTWGQGSSSIVNSPKP